MSKTRSLAAIVFTDIVGYTRLMGSHEQKALDVLQVNRELHKQAATAFNGTIIKEIGDGILIKFSTISDALNFSIQVRDNAQAHGAFTLRIGIHMGEIIEENNDVFGDGVNIASRIESEAASGEILCSDAVYKNLKNREDVSIEFLRKVRLKNVDELVRLYRIADEGSTKKKSVVTKKRVLQLVGGLLLIVILFFGGRKLYAIFTTTEIKPNDLSIAVLALENKTPNSTEDYITDGISEELINKLTAIEKLEVRSARQSFQFRDGSNLEAAGKELNVRYLLEGSSAQANNQLKISLRLVDLQNSSNTWSETFTYSTDSIFSIQGQLATRVLEALKVELSLAEKNDIQSQYTTSSEAWDLHLQAVEHTNNRSQYEVQKAINKWYAALAIDEKFDLAARNIANAYQVRVRRYDFGIEWVDSANQIIDRLLEVDPTNASYYRIKGWGADLKGNYSTAIEYYKQAYQYAVSRPDANYTNTLLAGIYFSQGKLEQAFDLRLHYYRELASKPLFAKLNWTGYLVLLREKEFANSINAKLKAEHPDDPEVMMSLAMFDILGGGDRSAGIRRLDSLATFLDTSDGRIHFIRGICRLLEGNSEEALHYIETAGDVNTELAMPSVYLAYLYKNKAAKSIAIEGEETPYRKKFRQNIELAEAQLKKWMLQNNESSNVPYNRAAIALLKGDADEAIRQLNNAIHAGYLDSYTLQVDPIWTDIRNTDSFAQILNQIQVRQDEVLKNILTKYEVSKVSEIPGLSESTFDKQMVFGIGISWEPSEDQVITRVVENSPAFIAGVKIGDKIRAIAKGNKRYTDVTEIAEREQWRYFQLTQDENVLRLKVERKGMRDLVEITIVGALVVFEAQGED